MGKKGQALTALAGFGTIWRALLWPVAVKVQLVCGSQDLEGGGMLLVGFSSKDGMQRSAEEPEDVMEIASAGAGC